MPSKREKNNARKAKEEGRKESEKSSLEILLSGHARTSQADILYVHQKAAKCMCDLQNSFVVRFSSL